MSPLSAPVLALACFILISSCAPAKHWTHDTKSTQEFYRDSARCEAMSATGGSNQIIYGGKEHAAYNTYAAISAAGSQTRIFQHCMMGEGWYLAEREQQSPDPVQQKRDAEIVKWLSQ